MIFAAIVCSLIPMHAFCWTGVGNGNGKGKKAETEARSVLRGWG
jgi:hypothetical protein